MLEAASWEKKLKEDTTALLLVVYEDHQANIESLGCQPC
jgi:hypothetical protein